MFVEASNYIHAFHYSRIIEKLKDIVESTSVSNSLIKSVNVGIMKTTSDSNSENPGIVLQIPTSGNLEKMEQVGVSQAGKVKPSVAVCQFTLFYFNSARLLIITNKRQSNFISEFVISYLKHNCGLKELHARTLPSYTIQLNFKLIYVFGPKKINFECS